MFFVQIIKSSKKGDIYMFDKKEFVEKYQGKILQDDGSVVSSKFN